ncbi:hypothetical protein [Chondrinema litorale]|uniref:hypothetical protein n=1 Tax=Chondrinema litorale TaxID=2994555 RepID=UPI002543C2A8|nr:hypothetical protein [Chondrinema litorale]UZS00054.1 hypothetical protein OQ292_39635 [Chondrinema litorale]
MPFKAILSNLYTNLIALMWLATPFIRPFTWTRIIFTYLISIVPLVTLWDGIVSAIRLYTPKMVNKLIKEVEGNENFNWETGIDSHTFGKVIYLIGYPK